jgi:hypothetical protein
MRTELAPVITDIIPVPEQVAVGVVAVGIGLRPGFKIIPIPPCVTARTRITLDFTIVIDILLAVFEG